VYLVVLLHLENLVVLWVLVDLQILEHLVAQILEVLENLVVL
jgi:hypothetical protein